MAKDTTKAAPLTEEELLKKEADLTVQTEQLAKDRETFESEKAELNTQSEKSLDERETALNEREAALNEREAALNEREAALEESTADVKEEIVPGLSFELDKEKFKFLDSAPKTILFDGKARTQKDLIKDNDALLQLSSNQSLIEKLD